MKKIVTMLGARPQFIKASAVSAAIARTESPDEVVIHTGQHFNASTSDVFFAELGMPRPAHHLGTHGGLHGAMTGRMLSEIGRVFMDEKSDAVMAYSDTSFTLAGTLAVCKKRSSFFGVPCVTLRDEAEWVELMATDGDRLASPAGGDDIHSVIEGALGSKEKSILAYGDGRAAEMIVNNLSQSPSLFSASSRTSGTL